MSDGALGTHDAVRGPAQVSMASLRARRWVIVIQRDRLDLYRELRESLHGDGRVRVILDRREADQRVARAPAAAERRRRERRQALTPQARALWETLGFRLFYQDHEMAVYETAVSPVHGGGRWPR